MRKFKEVVCLITKDRQYRNFKLERREKTADGKMPVAGNPVVFNRETVIWECDGVQYKEVVAAGALYKTPAKKYFTYKTMSRD